jgi:hypothetical protein
LPVKRRCTTEMEPMQSEIAHGRRCPDSGMRLCVLAVTKATKYEGKLLKYMMVINAEWNKKMLACITSNDAKKVSFKTVQG